MNDTNTLANRRQALCPKIFSSSGDLFFARFHGMHQKLLNTAAVVGLAPSNPEADAHTVPAPTTDQVDLVLRLWAGELKAPIKRKRGRSSTSLYTQAQLLVKNPLLVAMVRAVCLHHGWSSVQEECGRRQGIAEESEHWDQDENDRRIAMWESRDNTLHTYEGSLDDLADAVNAQDTETFLEALENFSEELDCE